MATNSALSFQGLSTGIQTDALVQAILAQEGTRVKAMQARQDFNNTKTSALNSMKSSLNTLMLSFASLTDKLNSRTVTSTDASNTYVTATATGASSGNYDLNVQTVATKARIASTLDRYTGTSSNPALLAFTASTAKTATGTVGFTIDAGSIPGGAVSGTFTVGGTSYALTGTNGTLAGAAGTPLEGLSVSVVGTGGGSGTLKLAAEPSNLAVADPAAAIFSGADATFAVQGTDGLIKTLKVTDNSLNGLKNAINASGAAVSATIINTGAGDHPYQLVIAAKDTGTGSTGGVITLAEVTGGGPTNTLGISQGSVDDLVTPKSLAGGLTSSTSGASAQDAVFTLNGIQLTRQSNVVKDAVDGVAFTLKQGGQTGLTTLTVAQDKTSATTGVQDVITKYNILIKAYKDASTSTKNADGSINQAPLSGDAASRAIIDQLRSTLLGNSAGLPGDSAFQRLGNVGIRVQNDGTLSLNTVTFQSALDQDPKAVNRLFSFAGDSNNGVVAVKSGGSTTATGSVDFNIASIAADGTITGTLNGVAVTGSNGTLMGTGSLAGLTLAVTGVGSGTLTLSRGAGQAANDLLTQFTSTGSGSISTALKAIDLQNRRLSLQIDQGQAVLDRRKIVLQTQFSKMEVLVAQMRASASSLSGA